ncbi:MAG: phenylalanine--tRNA ligase subunit alpha [Blastochloris sp.]|nr:phenylalanine--tRNA ligase subunit alpha [Blastochloris sp.]
MNQRLSLRSLKPLSPNFNLDLNAAVSVFVKGLRRFFMIDQLQQIKEQALLNLASVQDAVSLEEWRIRFLSRQGSLPLALEGMKDVPKELRPSVGKLANEVKVAVNAAFEEKRASFETVSSHLPEDTTLPGTTTDIATLHIVNQTLDRIVQIFRRMGFALADGPEIETEYHNFDALNTPADHPARNEQDTFYAQLPADSKYGRLLLRTQTSTVQIRTMESTKPPIKIIAPGRCYRRDEIDATHGIFFHQIEGLVIDEKVTLGDLKGTMEFFFKELLGAETIVRFRPHFFPFTEPSFEIDMARQGHAVRGKKWLEIAGCGMVDPAVLTNSGIDPEKYTGFAFGMGVERMALMLHGIPDLRLFYENDQRFSKQF